MWHPLVFANQIANHVSEDELYAQVKDKLQQQSLENKYEGSNWKNMNFLPIRT